MLLLSLRGSFVCRVVNQRFPAESSSGQLAKEAVVLLWLLLRLLRLRLLLLLWVYMLLHLLHRATLSVKGRNRVSPLSLGWCLLLLLGKQGCLCSRGGSRRRRWWRLLLYWWRQRGRSQKRRFEEIERRCVCG